MAEDFEVVAGKGNLDVVARDGRVVVAIGHEQAYAQVSLTPVQAIQFVSNILQTIKECE